MKEITKLLLLVMVSLLAAKNGYAQKEKDSLRQVFQKKTLRDTTSISVLLNFASYYYNHGFQDSSILCAREALYRIGNQDLFLARIKALRILGSAYVQKNNYLSAHEFLQQIPLKGAGVSKIAQNELANALNYKGIVASYYGNYDSAIHHFTASGKLYRALKNNEHIATSMINTGKMHMLLGNYTMAVKYLYNAFEYVESNDLATKAVLYINLGECYEYLGEIQKAKKYMLRALTAFRTDGQSVVGITESHSRIGNIYSQLGMSDSCTYHLERCIDISKTRSYSTAAAHANYNYSLHYKRTANWEQALAHGKISLETFRKEKRVRNTVNAMLLIAEAYFHLQETGQAFYFAENGLKLARELKARNLEKDFLKLLSDLYASQNNYYQAYQYSMGYASVKDSVLNQAKTRQIANMEALYESEKKKQELAVALAEKKATEAKLAEQKSRVFLLILGLLLTAAILLFGGYFYRALRKSKKTLDIQNRQLQKLNQTKDRFFTIVGHDLRGPITSFSGISNLIHWYIERKDLRMLQKLGEDISQSAKQLDTLLNNLLNWAVSQTEGAPYNPECTHLKELVLELHSLFHHLLVIKQVVLIDETSDELYVYADRNALMLVLRNLISNAIKFTPSGGKIYIRTRVRKKEVMIEVMDTGVGIPSEKLDTLFNLDQDKSTFGTADEKGTGLGLLLCKEYIELNKGTIYVDSIIGQGTTFTFTIPKVNVREMKDNSEKRLETAP